MKITRIMALFPTFLCLSLYANDRYDDVPSSLDQEPQELDDLNANAQLELMDEASDQAIFDFFKKSGFPILDEGIPKEPKALNECDRLKKVFEKELGKNPDEQKLKEFEKGWQTYRDKKCKEAAAARFFGKIAPEKCAADTAAISKFILACAAKEEKPATTVPAPAPKPEPATTPAAPPVPQAPPPKASVPSAPIPAAPAIPAPPARPPAPPKEAKAPIAPPAPAAPTASKPSSAPDTQELLQSIRRGTKLNPTTPIARKTEAQIEAEKMTAFLESCGKEGEKKDRGQTIEVKTIAGKQVWNCTKARNQASRAGQTEDKDEEEESGQDWD